MFFKVDLTKLDMYQKYEHKKPWFVNVSIFDPYIYSVVGLVLPRGEEQISMPIAV